MRRQATARPGAPALALALAIVFSSASSQAQIYRCIDADGRIEFSDLPCADDAEIIEPGGNLSVVARADSLDAAAIANRQFIDQRRADLAEQHRAAAERRRYEDARERAALAQAARQLHRSTPSFLPGQRRLQIQRQLEAQRRADQAEAQQRRRELAEADLDQGRRRETLLSRSGGNRERILD
jgi:hypothetical protein